MSGVTLDDAPACHACGAVALSSANGVDALCDECRGEVRRVRAETGALLLEGVAEGEALAATVDVALLKEGK